MSVIAKNKTKLTTYQYDDVSNVAYDKNTKIYTITYGNNTVTFSANDWYVFILVV